MVAHSPGVGKDVSNQHALHVAAMTCIDPSPYDCPSPYESPWMPSKAEADYIVQKGQPPYPTVQSVQV